VDKVNNLPKIHYFHTIAHQKGYWRQQTKHEKTAIEALPIKSLYKNSHTNILDIISNNNP